MQNRLVAENVIKTPLKGQSFFATNKKYFAYSTQQSIKIKSFNKDGKELQIKLPNNETVKNFSLAYNSPWIYVIKSNQEFQLYAINEQKGETISRVMGLRNVLSFKQVNDSLILECDDGYYRILPFSQVNQAQMPKTKQQLTAIKKKHANTQILSFPYNQNIYLKESPSQPSAQQQISVYSMKKTGKYEKCMQIDYVKNPIAVYRDKFVLGMEKENNVTVVNMFDINEMKMVGKMTVEGEFKYVELKENLLLLVMNVQATDYYNFCILNPVPTSGLTLITHKCTYQRNKGDFYSFVNLSQAQTINFLDKKKSQPLSNLYPEAINESTSSIIYVLNKAKQKVEIIKIDHSKILQCPFGEEKLEKKVVTNVVKNKVEEEKVLQSQAIERNRIRSGVQHKPSGKTLEETQRRFVESIIDVKIKNMMTKFEQLQKRVEKLERTMKLISEKIDQNMNSINREEIRTSVQSLFQQLTPQFEKYFGELFKQVSGVLDQGVSFYNKKLASQAQIHKQALNQIVAKTFEETEKVIELSKKEEKLSQRTEKHLSDLLKARKNWQQKTEEFEQQSRDVTFTETKVYREPTEGKVFVRADLNLASKRET